VNTYEWGDFRGNPTELVEEYFDAFLYLANWSQRYCGAEPARVWATDRHVILAFSSEETEDDSDDNGSGWRGFIIPVRGDLVAGDLRLLYLGRLLSAQSGYLEDETVEPLVPPGLGALPASLRSFVDFFSTGIWWLRPPRVPPPWSRGGGPGPTSHAGSRSFRSGRRTGSFSRRPRVTSLDSARS
jgi:hypothetical protein